MVLASHAATTWHLLQYLFESQSQSAPQKCSTVQYGFCPAATMEEYLRRWTATAHTSQTSTDVTIVFLTRVFSREGTQKNYYTRMEENPPKQKWRSFSKKQCMEMNVKCVTHNHCKVTKEWFITSTWLHILQFSSTFFSEFTHCIYSYAYMPCFVDRCCSEWLKDNVPLCFI